MELYTYAHKSRLLIEETIEVLRNKPMESTFYECRRLQAESIRLYEGLPQPLQIGYAANYLLEHASCPIEPQDILVGRFVEIVPTEEEEKQFQEFRPVIENSLLYRWDSGHDTLDWEEILKIGISGYIEKSQSELERKMASGAAQDEVLFLQGMNLIYRAYRRYLLRYAEAAETAGMDEAASVCFHLADNPPATFLEAMQLILFITNTYSVYFAYMNATLTCGRMDDLLRSYYENDLKNGVLTREDAGYIIDDFNCKTALILGRGEHQMSDGCDTGWYRNPMYDSPTYVILGGYSNHGDHKNNPLTQLFVERIHPRLENPVYVFRRTKDAAPDLWRLVCDKLRQNSSLLVYNDETVISALLKSGVEQTDAWNYTIHGCNWLDIQGMSVYSGFLEYPLPRRIQEILFDDKGQPLGIFDSMDTVYEAIGENYREQIRGFFDKVRETNWKKNFPVYNMLRYIDCFKYGTIEAASTCMCTVKYPLAILSPRYIGTAADMLAVLDTLVYGDDPVSLKELGRAVTADFAGYEALRKKCKMAPKYGQDDDRADRHARRLLSMLTDIMDEEKINPNTGKQDVYAMNMLITDMTQIAVGKELGATIDGRLAGTPVSENLSPTAGSSQSVTSLLNSVAKLPFERVASGALNVRMTKSLVSGEHGLEVLAALLATYFEKGGMQVQLSVSDTAELRAAQEHPEQYRDLMVRITGYSAVFVDMCKKAQEEFIRRDEMR